MSLPRTKYVVRGTDAHGNRIQHEEVKRTRARRIAVLMATWSGNPVTIEQHEYVDGKWQFKQEVK